MAKLRHITLSVDDMEKTAAFYEHCLLYTSPSPRDS